MSRIGVDKALGKHVHDFLAQQGYDVTDIDTVDPDLSQNFDAVVISGMEKDMFGMENTTTGAPVIDATGMSPQEIVNEVKTKVSVKH